MSYIKKLFTKLMSYVPTRLPVGLTEFHAWADTIISLSGKFADEDSMKFVIASTVHRLDPQQNFVSKNFFVKGLQKAAANQVAGQVFQDIKEKQRVQAEEAQKAAQQEATKENASDGQAS